jgi:hypothetical protein
MILNYCSSWNSLMYGHLIMSPAYKIVKHKITILKPEECGRKLLLLLVRVEGASMQG